MISLRLVLSATMFVSSCLTAGIAWSQTIEEAALRSALQLSQERQCASSDAPIVVVAMPGVDNSQSLSDVQLDTIRSDFLVALGSEMPPCARLTDALAAFGTVAFMTEVDPSGRITSEQQTLIESRLQNAHSVFSIKIDRQQSGYKATVQITGITDGQTISVVKYDLPDVQTATGCGATVLSEQRGLSALANDFLTSVRPIEAVRVATALYQDSEQTLGYGAYLTEQFLAALTTARSEQLFSATFPIQISEDQTNLRSHEFAISIRYWICEVGQSARITMTALSEKGETSVFTRNISLELLPAGISYEPPVAQKLPITDGDQSPSSLTSQSSAAFAGLVTITPNEVTTGDLLTISAEPPADCNPFFFDLAPGGRLTPLPLDIFDVTEIRPGLIRYDNNAESKYGITIQSEDERGTHRLGFICQPDNITNAEIRDIFVQLRTDLTQAKTGVIEVNAANVLFNTSIYEITD